MRSRRLRLTVKVTGEAKLERDLFLNLGRVQNRSLSIESIRPTIPIEQGKLRIDNCQKKYRPCDELFIVTDEAIGTRSDAKLTDQQKIISSPPHFLGNPVTTYFPGHPRAVFLQELNIGGSAWRCDCDGIG